MASKIIHQVVAENFVTTKANDGSTAANLTEVWVVDSTGDPFELVITSSNEALFVAATVNRAIPCILKLGGDYHFVTVRYSDGLSATITLESPHGFGTFTGAELTNRHEGTSGQHYSNPGYRAWADRMMNVGAESASDRSFHQPSGTASASWTKYGPATTSLADVTVTPVNNLSGMYFAHQQLSTRLQISNDNSSTPQGMRQTISNITTGNHTLIFEVGMSGNTVRENNLCLARVLAADGVTKLFEENFYEETKRFKIPFINQTEVTIEVEKVDTASTLLRAIHVGDLAIYDNVASPFTIDSGDTVCLIGDSWFASNQPTAGVIQQLESKGITALEDIQFDTGSGLETIRTAAGSTSSVYATDKTYNGGVGPAWIDIWLDYYIENFGTGIIIAVNTFTNDLNATANTYVDVSVKAPNGDTDVPLSLGADEATRFTTWAANMQLILTACVSRNLRMVMMNTGATADQSQVIKHGNASDELDILTIPVAYSLGESLSSLWNRFLIDKGFSQAGDSITGRQMKWLRSELNL